MGSRYQNGFFLASKKHKIIAHPQKEVIYWHTSKLITHIVEQFPVVLTRRMWMSSNRWHSFDFDGIY
jgi:hypothetical protein